MTEDLALPEPDGPDGHMSPQRAALVSLGLNDGQRERLADREATHVLVDLLTDTTPEQYLLQLTDAAGDHDRTLVLVGPLVFGWACSGQLTDLAGWADLWWPQVSLVIAPDPADPETYGMASETYVRVHARAGVWLHLDTGLAALEKAREVHPDGV